MNSFSTFVIVPNSQMKLMRKIQISQSGLNEIKFIEISSEIHFLIIKSKNLVLNQWIRSQYNLYKNCMNKKLVSSILVIVGQMGWIQDINIQDVYFRIHSRNQLKSKYNQRIYWNIKLKLSDAKVIFCQTI